MTPSSEQGPLRHLVAADSDIARRMNRDAILAELLEIEGMLLDAHAATWQPASQTFYRVGDRPTEAGSALVN